MQQRFINPLLAAVVGGALAAGFAAPASAAGPVTSAGSVGSVTSAGSLLAEDPPSPAPEPSPSETVPTAPVSPDPSPSDSPSATPSDSVSPSAPESPTPSPSVSTPAPDKVPPTGAFKLNLASIWRGQKVTLTQGVVKDNVSPAAAITRTVNWGDGTTSTLIAGQAPIAKAYAKAGKFTVTFTVTDEAGNKAKKTAAVTVTTPGKFKINKTSVWHGQAFKVTVSAVPAGTSKIVFYYGDGASYTAKGKNQTLPAKKYYLQNGRSVPAGAKTLTAKFTNKNGTTNAITVGKVTLKKDSWNPVVKITKPKNANKVSSWSTIRGTATDKGSGIHDLLVVVVRADNSGRIYCFTSKKKWLRLYDDTNVATCGSNVKASGGKWSLKVTGLKKGYIVAIANGVDWSNRLSKDSQVDATLTK